MRFGKKWSERALLLSPFLHGDGSPITGRNTVIRKTSKAAKTTLFFPRLETIDSSALQMTKDDAGSYVQPQQVKHD